MSARDYGSPTLRRRFLVARRDSFRLYGLSLHASPDTKAVKLEN